MLEISLKGEKLLLLPEKAILWPSQFSLLLSDLHIGKVQHFRKSGIALPPAASANNYDRIAELLSTYQIQRVFFLGDLFHSHLNTEWDVFCDFIVQYPDIQFELIKGNHDIIPDENFKRVCQYIHQEGLVIGPFYLSHHPVEKERFYTLSGHLHPGFRLRGTGKQSIRLPCFYFQKSIGILPAFGSFTGMATIEKKTSDRIYVIVENQVLEV